MEYKTLKAGDEREEGDEVRHLNIATGKRNGDKGYINDPPKLGPWNPVSLLGHSILPSDLMIAEFRRPCSP